MVKKAGLFHYGMLVVVVGLLSACVGPLARPTPDPALAPEIYIQKYSPNVEAEALPQGGTTATVTLVDDQAIAQTISISVFPADKLPKLLPGEGGASINIPKIGDQSMAYQAASDGSGGAGSHIPAIMLDFTKGNVQVHLSAYSIAGVNVPVSVLVKLAQEIEKSLPGQLPVQTLALTAELDNHALRDEVIKSVVLGKQSAVGASEVISTGEFSSEDVNHCLQFNFNKQPDKIALALYDEQQRIYLSKLTSVLNSEEAKKLQMTRCIDRSDLPAGKYHLGVWINNLFVSGYAFVVK